MRSLRQQAHVDHLIADFLFGDHLVLRIDRDLNIVADANLRERRHGAAVGIGQRYLVLAAAFEIVQQRVVATALCAQRLDFFREVFRARTTGLRFRGVVFVKALEIFVEALVHRLDELRQRVLCKVAILVVDRFYPRPIHGQKLAPEQIELAAEHNELTKHSAESLAIVCAEIGDGLEVRLQGTQQPDDFDVAMTFGFQPPARPHAVEITVDVELQQVAGRIARPASLLRRYTGEPRHLEIKPTDEGINKANGIVRADVIVNGLRKQKVLGAIESRYVRHAAILPRRQRQQNPITQTFHTVCLNLKRPLPNWTEFLDTFKRGNSRRWLVTAGNAVCPGGERAQSWRRRHFSHERKSGVRCTRFAANRKCGCMLTGHKPDAYSGGGWQPDPVHKTDPPSAGGTQRRAEHE